MTVKRLKTIGIYFLRISISLLLLIFLFNKIDVHALWQLVKSSNKSYLVIACIVVVIVDVLCFLRWDMLLRASGVRVPFKTLVKSFCGGMFFSILLPTSIGGDVVKTLDLAVHTRKGTEVASTVFLDRISGYVALVIVMNLACLLGWQYVHGATVFFSIALMSGVLVCILLVLFNPTGYNFVNKMLYSPSGGRIRSMITDVHEEMNRLGKKKRILFYNLCISLALQFLSSLSSFVICCALGVHVKFIYFLILLPIINAWTLLPISLGGLGVREVATAHFFAIAGLSRDIAVAMSLMGFFIIVMISSAGGLYYVFTLRHRRL